MRQSCSILQERKNILFFSICETRQQPKWGLAQKICDENSRICIKTPDITLASDEMSSWVMAVGLGALKKGLTKAKPATVLWQSHQPKVILKEQNLHCMSVLRWSQRGDLFWEWWNSVLYKLFIFGNINNAALTERSLQYPVFLLLLFSPKDITWKVP